MEPNPQRAPVPAGPRAVPPTWAAAPQGPSPADPARNTDEARFEILRRAEALEIPWERILLDEIQAEQTQRRYVEKVAEMPLATRLSLLSSSFLSAWRVRDQIQALSCAARTTSLQSAVRQLRLVFRRLAGQPDRGNAALATHLWLAYQRVLLLQRVSRAARRSRGTNAERMASTCSTARCSFDDAAWALCREETSAPGHGLDAAVGKVRDEGFQIPRASTEARSFAELRRLVRASAHPVGRRRSPARPGDSALVPRRVGLRQDLV
ncbi:MAG TPA: hypothetical protein VN032_08585 [Thermoanaerobaculia bacterium]|nr:hypothetical protein [Thermoanaerobaculia bacterium]